MLVLQIITQITKTLCLDALTAQMHPKFRSIDDYLRLILAIKSSPGPGHKKIAVVIKLDPFIPKMLK